MPHSFKLNPEPPKPLTEEIVKAMSHLADLLSEHFGCATRCHLELELAPDLRVERVLQGLASSRMAEEDLIERIRRQIRSRVGDLSISQMERMVDSALHGLGVQMGMMLGNEVLSPVEAPPSRRRIFSCPVCDEVFISQESLNRHLLSHGEDGPASSI